MTDSERAILDKLQNIESFEEYFSDANADDYADEMADRVARRMNGANKAGKHGRLSSSGVGASLPAGGTGGIPFFVSQIDVNMTLFYWNVTDSAAVLPAALPASLQTLQPVFIFGNSDYYSGFRAGFSTIPVVAPWAGAGILTIGVDATPAELVGQVALGDLIMVYTATVAAKVYKAYVIVSCPQVGYKTLLTSLSSDRIGIASVRYSVLDDTKVGQFGKKSNDFVSPTSYRNPANNQKSVIDIQLKYPIDKNKILGTYLNFDVVKVTWSLFIGTQARLKA
jgi:hypothetical protein